MNDIALVKKCQKGDKQAFEELIRLYYNYVFGFLLKSSGNESLTEDLTQETFLKVIQNIEKFDTSKKALFGTWVITIAKNCYIDYLRKNRIYLEDIDEIQLEDKVKLADKVITKLEYEEILKATYSLPKEQGIAIRLKYQEDMTLEQIAERLKLPSKTIKSRIHDGTVKLRKKLKTKERNDNL